MLQEPNYLQIISNELNLNENQVKAVLDLVQEWATVPFIARYRKERTWNLDENVIRQILELKKKEENLYQAKQTAINWIAEKWKLTPELEKNIVEAKTLKEVEEIYKPYKSKRKTKAMIAEEKGLLPVARRFQKMKPEDFQKIKDIKKWLENKLKPEEFEKIKDLPEEEIILWALEILSAEITQNTKLRDFLRQEMLKNWLVISKTKWEKVLEKLPETSKSQIHKFEIYKDFATPISKIKSYQILAINRWEKLGILTKKLEIPDDYPEDSQKIENNKKWYKFEDKFFAKQEKIDWYNYKNLTEQILLSKNFQIKSSDIPSPYKKLYESVENEVFGILKDKAEDDGIEVFQSNLFELLMTKPSYGKKVLAIDPWYRTWSKVVLLDELGNPVKFSKIYLHKEQEAKAILKEYLKDADVVVIWNWTASWETAELVLDLTDKDVIIVNESGASVYSASKVAQEEFPDLDLTDRWTVSIWRRYIDPLSELVKIPVWSIWVGMYQHDMNEKKLEEKLGYVVEDVVNQVWINVNTASVYVLKNISWIDLRTAKKIYKNRPYSSREDLKKVLSEKVYEQAIWFLRVPNSSEPLDNTDIHPEQYNLVSGLQDFAGFQDTGLQDFINYLQDLKENEIENLARKLFKENQEEFKKLYKEVNIETIKFILKALKNAGKDPRKNFAHKKAWKKLSIEDVKEWDILTWIVRNIMPFGVFVDVGLKNDWLVHISQLANEFVKDPADFVNIWDEVKVKIIGIDKEKGKIQLSMKDV